MKRLLSFFALGVTVVIAIAATVKISDLPLSTSPSTNTFIEIADMNAVTKSSKFLFNGVTYKAVTNGMDWSGDTNNVIGGDGRERTVAGGSSLWTTNYSAVTATLASPLTGVALVGDGPTNNPSGYSTPIYVKTATGGGYAFIQSNDNVTNNYAFAGLDDSGALAVGASLNGGYTQIYWDNSVKTVGISSAGGGTTLNLDGPFYTPDTISAGSTNAWKLGAVKSCSGLTMIVTNYIEVVINGTTNAIPLGTITP